MTTRRDFLKTMGLASAGLAFGSGEMLGLNSAASRRNIKDKVKIAYIGIGNRPVWLKWWHYVMLIWERPILRK